MDYSHMESHKSHVPKHQIMKSVDPILGKKASTSGNFRGELKLFHEYSRVTMQLMSPTYLATNGGIVV
jgi:hypothetical protein